MESDDDIECVGHVHGLAASAPHHRYYGCPVYKAFVDPSTKKPSDSDAKKFCPLCVCFVCDVPCSQCGNWPLHCEAAPPGYARPGVLDWMAMKRKVRALRTFLMIWYLSLTDLVAHPHPSHVQAKAERDTLHADALWSLYSKPRVSGAWVTGVTAIQGFQKPASAPLPVPTTPVPCVLGSNPRIIAKFTFTLAPQAGPQAGPPVGPPAGPPPLLDPKGWATREMIGVTGRAVSVFSAPKGSYCLHNWPERWDHPRPVLSPSDEELKLLEHVDPMPGSVFVSVLVIPEIRRLGITLSPGRRAFSTLGDLLDRMQTTSPSANGAWRGIIIGRDSMKVMVDENSQLVENDAVHVFDVSNTFMWVCTDWAPPIAVSVSSLFARANQSRAMNNPMPSLVKIAHASLAAICDDKDPLPQPTVRSFCVIFDIPIPQTQISFSVPGGFFRAGGWRVVGDCHGILPEGAAPPLPLLRGRSLRRAA